MKSRHGDDKCENMTSVGVCKLQRCGELATQYVHSGDTVMAVCDKHAAVPGRTPVKIPVPRGGA